MLVFAAFRRFRARPLDTVVVDEDGVRRRRAGDVIESVRWAQLINVTIVTTDEGPFAEDFFWLLRESDGSGCAIGSEQATSTGLLEKLQRLPGFDNQAVVDAIGSTSNALFLCWEGLPDPSRSEALRASSDAASTSWDGPFER